MDFSVTFRVAGRALMRNKARSLLTTLGIIVGIAAVIAMMAVGEGAKQTIREQVGSMGDNLLLVFAGSSRVGGFRGGTGTVHTLTNEDGEVLKRELDYIKAYSPGVRSSVQVVYKENNWSTAVFGVNSEYPIVRKWDMAEGEFFSESDVRISARVCVLGKTVVDNLFGTESPVGKTIRIKNMQFKVIGVFAPKGSSGFGSDQDDVIVMPWTTVRAVIASSPFNDVNSLMISLQSMEYLEQAKADITQILRQRHRLAPGTDDDFNIVDLKEVTNTISQVTTVMTLLLTVIASISLVVGGIGIMNIMLVSVTERTREIGLRMAVGARRKDILLQFIVESIVLSGVGGLIGLLLGTISAVVLSYFANWPVLVAPSYIVLAISFSAGVGVFFGFYPAWRASNLNPIEALRYE